MLTIADVDRACSLIAGHVRQTPVIAIEGALLGLAEPVCLKLEMLQHAGSFKPRGAFNRILAAAASGPLPADGVIAASGGNHGLAVAHVARQLGIPALIFVPEATSALKVARIRALGATVTVTGAMYADAYDACLRHAATSGALFVHAYDQPEVVAGQGTLGRELLTQAAVDTVLVAVGGGGLAAGVRLGAGPGVKLVAVEPERIPTLHAALAGSATWPSRCSRVDATAPVVSTTFPLAGARYTNNTNYNNGCGTATTADICGTASDSGLNKVEISVRRASTGLYLTGTTFSAASQNWITATGTTSWNYALAATTFPCGRHVHADRPRDGRRRQRRHGDHGLRHRPRPADRRRLQHHQHPGPPQARAGRHLHAHLLRGHRPRLDHRRMGRRGAPQRRGPGDELRQQRHPDDLQQHQRNAAAAGHRTAAGQLRRLQQDVRPGRVADALDTHLERFAPDRHTWHSKRHHEYRHDLQECDVDARCNDD